MTVQRYDIYPEEYAGDVWTKEEGNDFGSWVRWEDVKWSVEVIELIENKLGKRYLNEIIELAESQE